MRDFIPGAAAILLTAASPATAATLISTTPGAPDPGASGGYVIDFENPIVAGQLGTGLTISGAYQVYSGDFAPNASAPAGNASKYLAVPGTGYNGFATIDFTGYTGDPIGAFSFYWGSIDSGNALAIVTSTGTYTFSGSSIIASGFGSATSATANQRVGFALAGGETLQALRFYSDLPAFEVDDIVLQQAIVPEPATWALMILGFGAVGGMLRRRTRLTTKSSRSDRLRLAFEIS